RQRCRTGRGHEGHGPPAHCSGREARAGPVMAHPALWQLGELPAARRTGDLAALGRANFVAADRCLAAPQAHRSEAGMNGFLTLGLLGLAAIALLWLMRLRGPVLTMAIAAILFGCAGYALQGSPGLGGRPR